MLKIIIMSTFGQPLDMSVMITSVMITSAMIQSVMCVCHNLTSVMISSVMITSLMCVWGFSVWRRRQVADSSASRPAAAVDTLRHSCTLQ